MIVKKIPRGGTYPGKEAKTKAAHIGDLCGYVIDARHRVGGPDTEGEKVLWSGAEGFIFEDRDAQISEMIALSAKTKAAQPCEHFVLSWRPEEHPNEAQARGAVQIFLEEAGMTGHQVIWAAHGDTDAVHVHVVVNRVNSETERLEKINNGFDKLTCQRAAKRIEDTYHLQPVQNNVVRKMEQEKETYTAAQLDRARALVPLIQTAATWQELHNTL